MAIVLSSILILEMSIAAFVSTLALVIVIC
nr:MAG TPA: hypothetical protein [Caudoviricetes sp.]